MRGAFVDYQARRKLQPGMWNPGKRQPLINNINREIEDINRKEPQFNNPKIPDALPVQQTKVRHQMLRAGYFHKGRYQGILVRIGLHKNIKQVVYHKKSEKQNDPLDE